MSPFKPKGCEVAVCFLPCPNTSGVSTTIQLTKEAATQMTSRELRKREGAGVGMAMAVSASAQAGQNFAPVGNGAPQAEQWMFMTASLRGRRIHFVAPAMAEYL
jgi:hypothetical protein